MEYGPDDLIINPAVFGNPAPDVVAEACRAAGIAAVSIWGTYLEGSTPAAVGKNFRDAGVDVFTVEAVTSWWKGPEDADAAGEEAATMIELADASGADGILAVSMEPDAIDLGLAIDGLGDLCDRAAERGLWVAVEFLPWSNIPDLAAARDLVEGVGRPNLGYVLDSWHFTRSGSSIDDLAGIAPKVRAFQISDTLAHAEADVFEENMHRRLVPGAGSADLVGIIRALDAGGMRGPVAIEVFSDELVALAPVDAAVRTATAARAVVAEARMSANP
jgi:sugar phosphate isomerase/epimerase